MELLEHICLCVCARVCVCHQVMAQVNEHIPTNRGGAQFRLHPLNCTSRLKDGGEAGSGVKKMFVLQAI